jgi:multiple sugar transport system ATP-binding protein
MGDNTVRVLVRGRTGVRPGETIHLAARPDDLHVFDGVSGRRRDVAP